MITFSGICLLFLGIVPLLSKGDTVPKSYFVWMWLIAMSYFAYCVVLGG